MCYLESRKNNSRITFIIIVVIIILRNCVGELLAGHNYGTQTNAFEKAFLGGGAQNQKLLPGSY